MGKHKNAQAAKHRTIGIAGLIGLLQIQLGLVGCSQTDQNYIKYNGDWVESQEISEQVQDSLSEQTSGTGASEQSDSNLTSWQLSVQQALNNDVSVQSTRGIEKPERKLVEMHRKGVDHKAIENIAMVNYNYIKSITDLGSLDEFSVGSNYMSTIASLGDGHDLERYNAITEMLRYEPCIKISQLDNNEIDDFVYQIWYLPDQLMWTLQKEDDPNSNYYKMQKYKDLGETYIDINFKEDQQTSESKREEMHERSKRIVKYAEDNGMNTPELMSQFIICYLQFNQDYDYDTWDTEYDSQTAYGPLVTGKAICSGYSKAFIELMSTAGYESGIMQGLGKAGGAHAWNVIKTQDGEKVYIDVTESSANKASWDIGYDININAYTIEDEYWYKPYIE